MNTENTKKLIEAFPALYRGYKKSPRESLMCFGFECGDGWFDLIWELSEKITAIDPNCEANQVKEKFGGLRFYILGSKEAQDLALEYEEKSYSVCEMCGSDVDVKTGGKGWIQTLCGKCRNN